MFLNSASLLVVLVEGCRWYVHATCVRALSPTGVDNNLPGAHSFPSDEQVEVFAGDVRSQHVHRVHERVVRASSVRQERREYRVQSRLVHGRRRRDLFVRCPGNGFLHHVDVSLRQLTNDVPQLQVEQVIGSSRDW